jgi:hypothetical protein
MSKLARASAEVQPGLLRKCSGVLRQAQDERIEKIPFMLRFSKHEAPFFHATC